MRYLLPLIFFLPLISVAQEAVQFNNRFHLGLPAVILNSVIATDSCYYGVALVADSVPPYRSGAAFIKFGPDGEIADYNWEVSSEFPYETWDGNLVETDDSFVINGYTFDTIMKAMLLFWSKDGELMEMKAYPNFFSPGEFVRATALTRIGDRLVMLSREVDPNFGRRTEFVCSYMDITGGVIWKKSYGGTTNREEPYSIAVLNNNAIILGGYRTNQSAGAEPNPNAHDYIIAIDSTGQQQWQYISPSTEYRLGATAMTPGADGGIIVASGRGEKRYVNSNGYILSWGSGLIYKLNSSQQVEWEVEFTEPRASYSFFNNFRKIIRVSDGSGYIAAGNYVEAYDTGFDIHGWLVKISIEGDSLWRRKLRFFPPRYESPPPQYTSYEHYIYDIKETLDGGFVMAGLADHFGAGWQGQQGWLIKVDEHGCLVPGCELVSVREPGAESRPAMKLYPNPARDYLNVLLKDEHIARRQGAQLRILDMQGRQMQSFTAGPIDEVTHILPVHTLPAGMYVLQYTGDGSVLGAERFVVE